jgi:hypothetical protein
MDTLTEFYKCSSFKTFLRNKFINLNREKLKKILGWTLVTSPVTTSAAYFTYGNQKYIKPATEAIQKDKTPIGPIPNGIFLIQTKDDVDEYVKNKQNFDPKALMPDIITDKKSADIATDGFKEEVYDVLSKRDNAAFMLPSHKRGQPVIILPKKIGGKVLAHEVGHYLDSVERKAKTLKQFDRKIEKDGIGVLASLVKSPKLTGEYKAEVKAWEKAEIPEKDLLRQKALASYEFGGKAHRPFFYSLPLAGLGAALLARR